MRHTISVTVENKFGVLTRVAGLFSGRGYNIDTLNVAPTQYVNTSRRTSVTYGDDATVDQVVKQLNKLVDVLKVEDYREGEYIDRELVLVRVAVDARTRAARPPSTPASTRAAASTCFRATRSRACATRRRAACTSCCVAARSRC